jgi:hypothetical protein
MCTIAVSAGQLTQQIAIAAGRGFELQHGVIDAEGFKKVMPYFFSQRLRTADRLVWNHHMAGKRYTVR